MNQRELNIKQVTRKPERVTLTYRGTAEGYTFWYSKEVHFDTVGREYVKRELIWWGDAEVPRFIKDQEVEIKKYCKEHFK